TSSAVRITVDQVLTSIKVSPAKVTLSSGAAQQFSATALDQFGRALASPPAFAWSMTGVGAITTTGLYKTPLGTGTGVIRAASGSVARTASVTVVAATTPVTGLSAAYFNSLDLTGTPISRVDGSVNFDWGGGSPAVGINVDGFSARWTGKIVAIESGQY